MPESSRCSAQAIPPLPTRSRAKPVVPAASHWRASGAVAAAGSRRRAQT